jgi:hypothetical protein
MAALDVARAFEDAWTRDKDFVTARGYLVDDFRFEAPTGKNESVDEFIRGLKLLRERRVAVRPACAVAVAPRFCAGEGGQGFTRRQRG